MDLMFSVTWGICGKIIYHFFLDEINRKCAKSMNNFSGLKSNWYEKIQLCMLKGKVRSK